MDNIENDKIDIREDDIYEMSGGQILKELLTDHTKRQLKRNETGDSEAAAYIIWATEDYSSNGDGYHFGDEIKPELITGEYKNLIMPRVLKEKTLQTQRSKDKAEVFTPSWVCNNQNNLIDEAWFGRKDVFNSELTAEDGAHDWMATEGKISFDGTGKTWKDYVRDTRMEITCGEGPYLVSRYDTTTGEEIPLEKRIGLFDRKMRVISENVSTIEEWKKWTKIALHNIYGFEWQGDSLLLAREAVLYSIYDYYEAMMAKLGQKFQKMRSSTVQSFVYIISWNLWQMDGLKFVIPGTCHDTVMHKQAQEQSLFGDAPQEETLPLTIPCPGCAKDDIYRHNGIYPKIRDWGVFDNDHKDKNGLTGKQRCDVEFVKYVNMKHKAI